MKRLLPKIRLKHVWEFVQTILMETNKVVIVFLSATIIHMLIQLHHYVFLNALSSLNYMQMSAIINVFLNVLFCILLTKTTERVWLHVPTTCTDKTQPLPVWALAISVRELMQTIQLVIVFWDVLWIVGPIQLGGFAWLNALISHCFMLIISHNPVLSNALMLLMERTLLDLAWIFVLLVHYLCHKKICVFFSVLWATLLTIWLLFASLNVQIHIMVIHQLVLAYNHAH